MIGPRGTINPLNDYAFLKTLGEKGADKPLRSLVNAVLNEAKQPTLSNLTINTRHFNASDIDGDKSCVLDVTASAKQGKVNVEVQIVNNGDIELRLLFYWAKLFTAKFKKGQDYKTLNNVISIAILDYVIDDENPDFLSHFQIKNTKNGKLFSNALNIFVIEMPKFRALKFKDINNPLHQWLLFLDENTEQNIINKLIDMNANIKQAHENLNFAMQSDDQYDLYVRRKIAQMDYNNGLKTAREKGKREGVRKGRKQGKEAGMRIGVEKGKMEKEVEMILELHNIGLPFEKIAQAAKKSVNDVLAVVNKQKMKEKVFAV